MPATAKWVTSPDIGQAFVCAGDKDLIEACRRGNLSAFEHLYHLHGPRMKSLAWNLLGNRADAEDAVQESFLKIYQSLAGFRGEAAFSTWIFRLLVNTCYDLARKRQRSAVYNRLEEGGTQEDPSPPEVDHPLRLTLEQSLRRLNLRLRSVFLLFEVEGFSHREIAGILQIAEGTSKALLFEAKRKLKDLIGDVTRNS